MNLEYISFLQSGNLNFQAFTRWLENQIRAWNILTLKLQAISSTFLNFHAKGGEANTRITYFTKMVETKWWNNTILIACLNYGKCHTSNCFLLKHYIEKMSMVAAICKKHDLSTKNGSMWLRHKKTNQFMYVPFQPTIKRCYADGNQKTNQFLLHLYQSQILQSLVSGLSSGLRMMFKLNVSLFPVLASSAAPLMRFISIFPALCTPF